MRLNKAAIKDNATGTLYRSEIQTGGHLMESSMFEKSASIISMKPVISRR